MKVWQWFFFSNFWTSLRCQKCRFDREKKPIARYFVEIFDCLIARPLVWENDCSTKVSGLCLDAQSAQIYVHTALTPNQLFALHILPWLPFEDRHFIVASL